MSPIAPVTSIDFMDRGSVSTPESRWLFPAAQCPGSRCRRVSGDAAEHRAARKRIAAAEVDAAENVPRGFTRGIQARNRLRVLVDHLSMLIDPETRAGQTVPRLRKFRRIEGRLRKRRNAGEVLEVIGVD